MTVGGGAFAASSEKGTKGRGEDPSLERFEVVRRGITAKRKGRHRGDKRPKTMGKVALLEQEKSAEGER